VLQLSDIDECEGVTCGGVGTCVDGADDYQCNCPPGYTGDNCETGNIYVWYIIQCNNLSCIFIICRTLSNAVGLTIRTLC